MDRDEEQRRRRGEHTRSYSQDRPIGSGENARSLVRGVKQWLPDIPGSVGGIADMLYAGGANVLQGQKQRSVAPLGAGPAIRRAIGKKAPLEQVEMRATPETDWWEEGARFANPAMFMSPKNIAQLGGLALAGGVPGAELGMIRRGGRTDLNMVHNMDKIPENIAEFFAQRGSMTNPSIAIARDKVYPFALKPTLVMNPSSHAFDPRTAQRLGIKAGYPMDLIPAEYKPLYEDITKGVVGDVRRVSQLADDKRDYSGLNGSTKRHVDKPLYYDMLEDPANAESLARDTIPRGDAVAADAASILTAKDAYADGGLVGRQEFNGAVGYILD